MRGILKLVGVVFALTCLAAAARGDDWPQWLGPQRDGIWRETGIIQKFPPGGLKPRWRAAIGMGYSGPAVAGGKVYVTDRVLAPGAKNPDSPFSTPSVPGAERVLCLSESTGEVLWKHEYDCEYKVSYAAGPRTTPVVTETQVYTLGAMGDLLCLDIATGKPKWSKNFPKDYKAKVPFWGFSASPLLDGDRLICLVGGEENVVVAFHKDTGKELWHALSAKEIGYCPPMMFDIGGKRQLIVWHPESVNGLDPDTGKLLWTQAFPIRSAMTIPTPRLADGLLLVSCFYNGSMVLKTEADKLAPRLLWKSKSQSEQPDKTDTLHAVMSTPVIKDGYIYGVCSYGALRCLKADTGERLWKTQDATGGKVERWANAFIVSQGDRYFLFNEKGDLIIARLAPQGYTEISRTHVIEPTNRMVARQRDGQSVVWSHPAFANKCIYVRNDKEIVCISLAAEMADSR